MKKFKKLFLIKGDETHMLEKWHDVYSYFEMVQIYVYWTNCEFQKYLLWTPLLKFCLG